jgi:transcription antitermination factor NusG
MTDRNISATVRRPDVVAGHELNGWYALHVKAKAEKAVARGIREKGYKDFLPLYQSARRWSDRIAKVEEPLFPGYVFCRAEQISRPLIITTPGIIRIVSFGDRPAVIPNREIDAITRALAWSMRAQPHSFLCQGQRARIRSGPLVGIEGIVVRTNGRCRLVLSVEALCRSIAIEVEADNVAPLDDLIGIPNALPAGIPADSL